jgi:hypothetical protein
MVGGSHLAEESLGLNSAWYADILITLTTGGRDGSASEGQGDAAG